MIGRGSLALAAALIAAFSSSVRQKPTRHAAATHTVRIAQSEFMPAELDAARGDTIVWVNADIIPHATAADSGAWTSRELESGERFVYVASDTGRFPYHCSAHPDMRALLIVR